ncbi:hypothetical protein GOODEAATRI_014163 [Goodea atripinnis]|uniref:Uncharacterized protein n=1 Tax=Goodea atripinnis TaxID=208336 RepID=A0ABV0MHM6_9TELE
MRGRTGFYQACRAAALHSDPHAVKLELHTVSHDRLNIQVTYVYALTPAQRLVVVYRAAPGFSAMALLAYVKSLFILQLLMGFVFVVSGLIINFIQLCTCILWPINRQLYRRINCRLSYSLWSREYFMLLLCAARCLDSL